jgi:hypothetical protein
MPGQHGPNSMRGSHHPRAALDLFASCAPGLDSLLAGEVAALVKEARALPFELAFAPGATVAFAGDLPLRATCASASAAY